MSLREMKRRLTASKAAFVEPCLPTIATALAATPILEVLCPACQTVGSVDIRTWKRHPGMAISD